LIPQCRKKKQYTTITAREAALAKGLREHLRMEQNQIGYLFNVSQSTVSYVVNGVGAKYTGLEAAPIEDCLEFLKEKKSA
jgi:predicted transcriptional regulator